MLNSAGEHRGGRTLQLIVPFIENFKAQARQFRDYYATTTVYGEQALAGWGDDNAMSDSAFLIAAYRASQVGG